jgi:predicted DNA-binding WGR domain protein
VSDESTTKPIFFERIEWFGPNDDNKGGKSDKFYEAEVRYLGRCEFLLIKRWGKTGTKGQTREKTFRFCRDAERAAQAVIAKKRAKGYTNPVSIVDRLASLVEED